MPRKGRADFLCLDCGVDTGKIAEYYMLLDEIWRQIHDSAKGMVCIGCAETRLGRELVPADFNDSYLNRKFSKSIRLANRQGVYDAC